ncbi:MAG: 2-oxoacid:acceptor oxidoreductase subunit alpha, partial [Caulobacteraceae bacterium]
LGIEEKVVDDLIAEEFAAKPKLVPPNLEALAMGRRAAREIEGPMRLQARRLDKVGDRIFVQGNDAAALGAVFGGATVCAWYPITPSTSLAEAFMAHCKALRTEPETGKARYAILQAEDEIASIGVVLGAGWNGARAFTCTSGPGISLMQEFVGLSYYAEIPAVIFDVQRGGPSTGMPTRTQQADLILAAYASHGDTKHPLLFPADPHEAFEFSALAFDLAERLQTTIFVMLDLDIGMNEWLCAPFVWDESRRLDRGKVLSFADLEAGRTLGRYRDVDGDGIPWRTIPGVHPSAGSYFTRGSSHDADARYSEEGGVYVANMERLLAKFATASRLVPAPVERKAKRSSPYGTIYFGSTAAPMDEALASLEAGGVHLDALRVRGFPFSEAVARFIAERETLFVVEQNRDAQLRTLLVNELGVDPAKLVPILNYDGSPITARFITEAIAEKVLTR